MPFIPDWPAPANIKAFTTNREEWGEPGCRVWLPQAINKLVNVLQLPDEPVWLRQHHSITVVEALPANRGMQADASFTHATNRISMVETADCLPVLICNRPGTVVAAIHAGWRGLANGVLEATLQSIAQPSEELLVWLGPAIGPSHFEVGLDVYEAFVHKHADAAQAFTVKNKQKWLADLYTLARLRLNLQGITAIYGGEYCTFSQPELFYSYRRDGAGTGRMASVIWIDDNKAPK